jgi:hypothetical protein
MLRVFAFFSALLASMRGSRVSRDPEILFLRQQLLVLRRSAPARVRLRNTDRLIFVWLYRLFPSLLDAAVIFKPESWCGGTAAAFAYFGAGSHVGEPVDPRYQRASAAWFGR